jgi:hypothetical protein
MFDSKFICTLIAMIVAVFAICNFDNKKKGNLLEGYWGNPGRWTKTSQEAVVKGANGMHSVASLPAFSTSQNGGHAFSTVQNSGPQTEFYQVPGTYQPQLSPREWYGNVNPGTRTSYNMAPNSRLGAAKPMDFANMAKEGYCGPGGCGSGCGLPAKGEEYGSPPLMKADYANGNYNEMAAKLHNVNAPNVVDAVSMPVSDMTSAGASAKGDNVQPIVYDRLMFANADSRIRGQGCPIRGDLPIVPCSTGWFQVSARPSVQLQQGALSVLGGLQNETTQALSGLVNETGLSSTVSGINMTQEQILSVNPQSSGVQSAVWG